MSILSDALKARDKATKGKWYRQETIQPGEGIRTKNGFICFMFNPAHYPMQDERYAQEIRQADADATLIAAVPDALDWIAKALPWIEWSKEKYTSEIRDMRIAAGLTGDDVNIPNVKMRILTDLIAQAEGTEKEGVK